MIDPQEPLEVQVERQAKIIDALIQRATREEDIGGSAYSLFQSAIALQGEVWEKNRELERALDTLGRASNQLRIAEFAREQTQRNLADALEAMEGGFALFSGSELEICNEQFKRLVPDITSLVEPGLRIEDYLTALYQSKDVIWDPSAGGPAATRGMGVERADGSIVPPVFGLRGDRWFQITHKRASDRKVVLLSTEITSVVRQNRFEKDRLIDEQTRFVQAAFDHMTQGVCTFSAEGSLLIHNDRFRELLRLPVQLVRKGTAVAQILDFIFRNNLLSSIAEPVKLRAWEEQIKSGQGLKRQFRHLSGETLDIQIHALPDKGYIMNVMDITAEIHTTQMLEQRVKERTLELTRANERLRRKNEEQARIDEQLRVAKEQAEDAMRSKTRFFAAASHDLLQPINAAKLLISHLSEHAGDQEIGDTVKRLDRSFVSIESLLHALLDISRLDSTGTEMSVGHFCLGDLMTVAREAYAGLAEEKGLRLDVVPSSLWVRSDQRYLSRSIQNLVVNAIQYTAHGRVLVGCRRKGDQVVLEVWDTGIGISKKDQQRIFSEFTRVTSDGTGFGMGLGLSIVDRACRRLGHPVSVRSKPGIGSVFSITLPLVRQQQTDAGSHPDQNDLSPEDLDLIVLIVENNPDVLFATMRKVESWGASVLTAASTGEALAQVRELGMAPDIILADYQLDGDDNGIRTILALREETGAHIPAIMITASREETLAADSKQHDFTILTKPVQLSRLRPLIDWKTSKAAREEEQDGDAP